MKIVTARRICQAVLFAVFVWFCFITVQGTEVDQLRGWPINLFLAADPLVALGTVLTTHTFYAPLLLAVATIILTIILGRFFCGWVCPFGAIHQFTGWLANRKKKAAKKIQLNKYRKWQKAKYYVLFFMLGLAVLPAAFGKSLQTGLLDPIPLVTRSFNLVILPIVDTFTHAVSATPRSYELGWLFFAVFTTAVLLNLWIPRFYCRFVCPLGALFGLLNRVPFFRITHKNENCTNCKLCDRHCEGGCEPSSQVKVPECVLCFNCYDDCVHNVIGYQATAGTEFTSYKPDLSRRGFGLSVAAGVLAGPALRLNESIGENYNNKIIRPPGAVGEQEFLNRCIKCGQCMRVCPTNVIQPAGFDKGLEVLATPVINNRIGTSGCQMNCTACGYVCPTAAIKPITLSQKLGLNDYEEQGPLKIGTAFVDRSRCLPWAMGKPCIVCQENCPVSPKAIYTTVEHETIRNGEMVVYQVDDNKLTFEQKLPATSIATGDYFIFAGTNKPRQIVAADQNVVELSKDNSWSTKPAQGDKVKIKVSLQRPHVDIEKCIGCGVCEHECPVSGKRAIRVSAEGESRSDDRRLLL
ncbi:Putative electron transport protein YccM [Anaerohalosphaera lusitana]|uniref:Putative electron transport protein YccM n=1 Tax=Anaerohalosphaera lusitana TaxID=1936003 RepID=A0A1U9NGF5_9BACT|nr:4Fe-4S dicluster domain-containing protein [Anaerohalosphaera lusitana]AQT67021.1 Putative electron transport protein YccM [Anaerohalosphaera lusitana]